MKRKTETLLAIAMAGLMAGFTAPKAFAGDAHHDGAAATEEHADKASCKGKEGCKGKEKKDGAHEEHAEGHAEGHAAH